jgi:hypothetical protein
VVLADRYRDRSRADDIVMGLVALAVALVVIGQPSLHAVQKHGPAAHAAYTDTNHGTPRWRCNDGRIRTIAFIEKDTWAVCVDTPAGMNITCFYTYSSAYVLDVISRCLGPNWLQEHPGEAARLGL